MAKVVGGNTIPDDASLSYRGNDSWATPWPVGSIFLSAVSTNPATLLGFGTWVAIAAGRVLVGLDAAQSEFDTLLKTGGAKTHTLTTAEIPAHTHPSIQVQGGTTANTGGTHIMTSTATGGSSRAATSPESANANTGGGGAHNNLQPFLTIAVWQRTA